MMNAPVQQYQPLYQADPGLVQSVQKARERIHQACDHCLNRHVRVQTLDGQVHEGVVVHVDDHFLYLNASAPNDHARGFFNPLFSGYGFGYNNVVLPLVLYNLLAITLLG